MHWLLELCITTSCFCAGIYCTKNRMSQCVSMRPQWRAMIWREKKVGGGRYAEVDSNSACLAGLFLAPISILITRVTPSVLKILRGSLLYLLHFQGAPGKSPQLEPSPVWLTNPWNQNYLQSLFNKLFCCLHPDPGKPNLWGCGHRCLWVYHH